MTWKPEEEMGPQRMYGLTVWVRRLLVANLLVFLVQKTLLIDPSYYAALGFEPLRAWERPWTFLTYMFLHGDLLHLIFNMLMLFMFGASVEDRMGSRTFILFYLLCGLGGALLSFILMEFARVGLILGASGAILGVPVAFAWYWPHNPGVVLPLPAPRPREMAGRRARGLRPRTRAADGHASGPVRPHRAPGTSRRRRHRLALLERPAVAVRAG